jgi:predicted nucleic acid-binding protein
VKAFLDANVLVTVLNKEYPLFPQAARLMSLAGSSRYRLYTSPICLAIAFYFAEKKSGRALAKAKLALLAERLAIADVGQSVVWQAATDPRVLDFEDGLAYYAAKTAGCTCLITEDGSDFHFADIEIIGTRAFLQKHVV